MLQTFVHYVTVKPFKKFHGSNELRKFINTKIITWIIFNVRISRSTVFFFYLYYNVVKKKPLATNDAFWHHQILATCYQLAQSVLKIGSALAERVGQGEVGGSTTLPDSAWWRLQLPVEKPWSMTDGPFVCFLAQTGVENAPFTS